jgi:hypothetical protein
MNKRLSYRRLRLSRDGEFSAGEKNDDDLEV